MTERKILRRPVYYEELKEVQKLPASLHEDTLDTVSGAMDAFLCIYGPRSCWVICNIFQFETWGVLTDQLLVNVLKI